MQSTKDGLCMAVCAGKCATKALLAGDAGAVADAYHERVLRRGTGGLPWGWTRAYGKE